MSKKLLYIIIPVLILLAFSGEPSPKIAQLHSQSRIIAFGDSITYGTGADESESYPALLSKKLGINVENCGVPGEVTATGLERLPTILEENRPDLVILCHGGNDILRNHDKNKMRDNLEAMINLIKDSGSDIILIGVPQKSLILSSPPLYQELAEKYKIPYNDDLISDIIATRSLKSDYIHPNAKGYKKMADSIHALIQNCQ